MDTGLLPDQSGSQGTGILEMVMQNTLIRRWGVILVTTCMLSASILQPAIAAVISTETAIELEARQTQIDHINDILAQEDLRIMLVRLGVDPEHASARVQALTNEELQALQQSLEDLPAGGGVLEVIGIVAIVIIVLELLDVTNFFSQF